MGLGVNDFPLPRSQSEDFAAGAEVDVAGTRAHDAATDEIVENGVGGEGRGDAT